MPHMLAGTDQSQKHRSTLRHIKIKHYFSNLAGLGKVWSSFKNIKKKKLLMYICAKRKKSDAHITYTCTHAGPPQPHVLVERRNSSGTQRELKGKQRARAGESG